MNKIYRLSFAFTYFAKKVFVLSFEFEFVFMHFRCMIFVPCRRLTFAYTPTWSILRSQSSVTVPRQLLCERFLFFEFNSISVHQLQLGFCV